MNLPSLRTSLLSAATLALAACGSSEGAKLQFSVHEVPVHAHSLASQQVTALDAIPTPSFQSSDGVKFSLTQARIHLRDIRLDLPKGTKCEDVIGLAVGVECKGSDSSKTLVVPGPIIADLMTGTTTPDLSGLVVPAGNYKRIDFRLEEAKGDEVAATEPLLGYSLLLGANFAEQAGKTLELRLKFSEDARFESATGVDVPEGGTLIGMLNPAIWLEGLPLSKCLEKGDVVFEGNVLRIDSRAKGDCGAAEELVKTNVKRSADLRKWDE
jgi:hypothetical protein